MTHPALRPVIDTETIELLPAGAAPRLLFVLLHDANGTALEMLALGQRLGDAFAEAAVLIPEGLSGPGWSNESAQVLAARVRALEAFLRAQQQRFGALQSGTVLAGFGASTDDAAPAARRARSAGAAGPGARGLCAPH